MSQLPAPAAQPSSLTLEALPLGLVEEFPVRHTHCAADPVHLVQVQRQEEEVVFPQRGGVAFAAATSSTPPFLGGDAGLAIVVGGGGGYGGGYGRGGGDDGIEGGLGDKMEDWIEKLHQVGKQLRARYRTTRNLQKRAAARIRVVHRDTTPAVINQTMKVEETSKRKFTTIKSKKGGGDNLGERWAKRMKAFDERESIAKQSEYARVLSELEPDSKATKTEDSKGGE